LIGFRMVCVADIATHGQAKELAHEVIFQAGADDLAFIVKVFGPMKPTTLFTRKGSNVRATPYARASNVN